MRTREVPQDDGNEGGGNDKEGIPVGIIVVWLLIAIFAFVVVLVMVAPHYGKLSVEREQVEWMRKQTETMGEATRMLERLAVYLECEYCQKYGSFPQVGTNSVSGARSE